MSVYKLLAGTSDSTWKKIKGLTFDVGLTVQAWYLQQLVSAQVHHLSTWLSTIALNVNKRWRHLRIIGAD